ncbi:MAG: electron transport complex subunit RsxD [Cellvibrionaceae bacterium]|nr:electron transport complex subunit RsxD [Cellvibrionaceae bacterium]
MSFIRISSPHTHTANTTGNVMRSVILATAPGFIALCYFFGWGTVINLALCCTTAVACEALVLKLRGRPVGFYLKDGSALVTAVLLGLALPPYAPWWLVVVGSGTAIIVAKQLYGGLGFNPFNPAMVAYVVLLISFPVEMTRWGLPQDLLAPGQTLPTLGATLSFVFAQPGELLDAYTGATPLDLFKNQQGLLVTQIYEQYPLFSQALFAGTGWEWVNLGFLLGGLFLLYKKVFSWHAPVCMLTALALMAALFYDGGSSHSGGSPLLHLLSGSTMLGAFFIITDPVSSASSTRGRMIYGACIGILIYIIRVWGNYPDATAFAVLLMNFAAPFIDYYTLPRTYGHARSERTTRSREP